MPGTSRLLAGIVGEAAAIWIAPNDATVRFVRLLSPGNQPP